MTHSSAPREAHCLLPSGIRLHYVEAGVGHERILVLLHGYTDSWRSFELVIPLLAQSFHVVALDLRGHGGSSPPEGDYGTPQLARDVVDFLDAQQLSSITLVGHSLGSFVARRVAIERPQRIERLVLVGTALTAANTNIRALRREVAAFTGPVSAQFVHNFQAACVAHLPLVPPTFFQARVADSLRVPLHVWQATLNGMMDVDQTYRLGTIACPTLVLGGRADRVFNVTEQAEVAKAIPGARLRLYQHCGHSPHWEEPGRFAQDVQEFVEEPVA